MELEITEKKNNPLLKRTEVQFVTKHANEGTPNRKLIRSELADALNTKQENIIIDSLTSSFGSNISKGYAKAYSSQDHAANVEREFQLKRNKVQAQPKKKEEKQESAESKEKEEEK
ncbi:MAG: 30S ribosomal protein S24e [Candidatus Thermoplasmatota archaeon]|nr:30S ribosomal protein S24e [Candidatus Thermoplasmatota archaeon]